MSGYILSLYKAAMPSQEDANDAIRFTENKQSENGKAWNGAITFAHFDRVTVSPVSDFGEYRSVFDQSHWLGECRHVMIYDLPNAGEHSGIEFYDNPSCVFAFREAGGLSPDRLPGSLFACITMLNVDPGLYFAEHTKYSSGKDGGEGGSPLNRISDAIYRIVDEKFGGGGTLRYKIFGVLGENDLCIVWLSDQYTSITEAINYIRCITIKAGSDKLNGRPLVNTTYSVLIPNCKTSSGDTDFKNVEGDVELCLTLRNGYAGNTGGNAYCQEMEAAIRKNLDAQEDLSIDCSLGEYDIIFRFPARALSLRWYMKTGDLPDDGLLHYRNIEYVKNVFQVETVFLCRPQAVVDGEVYEFTPADDECTLLQVQNKLSEADRPKSILDRVEKIHRLIEKLLDDVKKVTIDSRYLHEALWLSYHEYLRIMPSSFCKHWIVDIDRQYYAMLRCISHIVEYNFYDDKTRAYREIEQMFNEIRQSFLHVTQTDRLFFELYQSTLCNAGSFNKILRAYYGLIKCVLYLCYTFKRVDGNKQAELVPLVTLNVTPIIESTMYTETFSPDVRLMVIRLPYKALTGLPQYMDVLIH